MKHHWVIICILLAGLILYLILFPLSRSSSVPDYRGDGEFQDLTRTIGPSVYPGYSIRLPAFDLDKPTVAEYSVGQLPNIGRRRTVCYLAIHDPQEHLRESYRNRLDASLRIEVLNSARVPVFVVADNLSKYIWASFGDFRDFHLLYQPTTCWFASPHEDYLVRISYTPDPNLAGYQGFLYFRAGGGK
jgi:hypothetical protein